MTHHPRSVASRDLGAHRSVPVAADAPGRLVEVDVDGTWFPGQLLEWREWAARPGQWEALVQYRTGVGAEQPDWVPAECVRQREEGRG